MRKLDMVDIAMALVMAGSSPAFADQAPADASLRRELQVVSGRGIFFGHQSVGENILDGLKELGAGAGVPLRLAAAADARAVEPGTLAHSFIGENRKPLAKLAAFERAFARPPARVDLALVKLCYTDIAADTDVEALFAAYRATIERLRLRHPRTVFVHVTTPLTGVEAGAKAALKRLLGRAPYGMLENLRRAQYNELLRRAYAGKEPIFDLARLESVAPDGSPQASEWNGRSAPALAGAYTDDGGHLNRAGRLRAARELVSVLAAVPR